MLRRRRSLAPCLPRPAKEPPLGSGWIHEIKHDGLRILAQRDKDRVQLVTRNGYDFTDRYPKIAAAVESLPVGSCLMDGEAASPTAAHTAPTQDLGCNHSGREWSWHQGQDDIQFYLVSAQIGTGSGFSFDSVPLCHFDNTKP
jgi:hypothetical protein